jgi:hypothetical protein
MIQAKDPQELFRLQGRVEMLSQTLSLGNELLALETVHTEVGGEEPLPVVR